MRLNLDIIEGPFEGKRVSIVEKSNLGRGEVEISIPDPKLSGSHAFFDFNPAEGWFIVDNQSRNGVWVNGHKEIKAILKDGDIIQLGSSKIICRFLGSEEPIASNEFMQWFQNLIKKTKNDVNPMMEIKPEIRLKVIRGVQFGESWEIFYGPRRAGLNNLDICLFDEKAPEESFEVLVKGKYAYFQTKHESIVLLNNQSIKNKQLSPGDIISIGESQLLVEFDEGHGFSS
jgi:pSer/pThr/pTyr-binding forkhead associated (FHA) protein